MFLPVGHRHPRPGQEPVLESCPRHGDACLHLVLQGSIFLSKNPFGLPPLHNPPQSFLFYSLCNSRYVTESVDSSTRRLHSQRVDPYPDFLDPRHCEAASSALKESASSSSIIHTTSSAGRFPTMRENERERELGEEESLVQARWHARLLAGPEPRPTAPLAPGAASGRGPDEGGRRRGPRWPSPMQESNRLPHCFEPGGVLAALLGLGLGRRPPPALGERSVRVWPASDSQPCCQLSTKPQEEERKREREKEGVRGRGRIGGRPWTGR